MAAAELRQRIKDKLVGDIEDVEHPSIAMLERVEQTLTTPDQLERHIEGLVERIEGARFPSVQMLNRVERLLERLERLERGEREPARQ